MMWTSLERVATQAIQFGLGILVARRLLPEDYGVIGMLAIFFAIAQILLDSGFANALIQRQNRTEVDYSTAFYFNIVVGVALYGAFYLAAPWIADFYGQPILVPITRIFAVSVILNSLTIVHTAKLTIDLDFRTQSLISIVTTVICGGLGVALAYSGFGVWAIVVQALANAGLRCVLLWITARWMPLLAFSVESFRQLFAFGSRILVSSLINTIYDNIYTIVIGKKFAAADVGFFNRGVQFATIPSDALTSIVVKVNYPILSSLQGDVPRLIRAYDKLLRTPIFFLAPVLVGMAVLADPMVAVLLGDKWLPCAIYVKILCFGCLWNPLTHINLSLLFVKGRSDLVLRLEFIKKPIAFLILLSTIPFGIKAICIGRAVYDMIAFLFNCHYTGKILGHGLMPQLKTVLPVFMKAAAMGAGVAIAVSFIDAEWVKLAVGVPLGACIYLGVGLMTRDESLLDAYEAARKSLHHKAA